MHRLLQGEGNELYLYICIYINFDDIRDINSQDPPLEPNDTFLGEGILINQNYNLSGLRRT